jgi:hypothetical protein
MESLIVQSLSAPILLADWLITCALAAVIAFAVTRLDDIRIDHSQRSVSLAGSLFPLLHNLLIFFAKYGIGVAIALAPAMRSEFAILDVAVSGASAGYFLAWVIRFASLYRREDHEGPSRSWRRSSRPRRQRAYPARLTRAGRTIGRSSGRATPASASAHALIPASCSVPARGVSRRRGWGCARPARTAAARHGARPADGSISAPNRRGDKAGPAAAPRAAASILPKAARCPRRS